MKEEGVSSKEKKNHDEKDSNFIQGRLMSHPPPGEEIVISGLAGTFPNSTDVYHFQKNLFNKDNMVSSSRRWDYVHPEIPHCSGTLPECNKYDAGFFGIHSIQAEAQDTMGRILIEKVVEGIFDAGLNLSDVEGTNTGVYVGTCFSESEKSIFLDKIGPSARYGFTGCTRSSLAHRVSYFLKLKGPSFIADTACSSSLFALEIAFRDLRLGVTDMAIVAGTNLCFHPFVSLQFARLGVLSLDGTCKVFDKSGNGYARSEAIATIILQKSNVAKRKYADIIYIKTNCDGFKEAGITYPSGETQCQLLTEFYRDSGMDPASLCFLEAHGTGTFVGDPEECAGIDEILAKCRKDPLLIGSVKSNIGHSEPASGICSITKCIIGMETGFIPPNIHFTTPRDNIAGIIEGRMKVVTEKTPIQDKRRLIGINSFGFGGGNCHVLLKANSKDKINNGLPNDDIPRVTCVSGRTEEAITTLLDEIKNNGLDAEQIRLLHDVFRKNIANHIYRGYSVLCKTGELCRFYEVYPGSKTPLYFAFGELSEWYNIGKDLMPLPVFSATFQKAQRLLLPKGINIVEALFGKTESKTKHQTLGCILVQMGLIDIFKALELQPTNYFGNSFGEILAAYFDGILTFKQTVDCAFAISEVIDKIADKHRDGRLGSNKIIENKSGNTVFANFRTAFKSSEFLATKKELLTNLSNILDKPKNQNIDKDQEKFGCADYFVNALTENFSAKFEYIESNSIVLSFGALPTINTDLDDVKVIQIGSSKDNLVSFLKILGNLYVNGYNPQLAKIYPEVKFPVSRGTRMISPFIRWKHDRIWFNPSYDLQATNSAQQGTRRVKVLIGDQQWLFVHGHVVDGRNLFPATGYLYLVWETLAIIEEVPMTVQHIVFEDCKFLRASTLPKKGSIIFFISLNRLSGHFEITEGGSIVVTGKILSRDSEDVKSLGPTDRLEENLAMNSKDVYKELRLRGYNYSGGFRSIQQCNINASHCYIKWDDNWITFLDNMLQLKILQTDTRLLYVPTYIGQLVIPVKQHLEFINKNYINKQKDPVLLVTCNKYTGEIRCGQMVINGLMASSISRRKYLGIPVLESYQFIPNVTKLQLEESIRVNMQIFLENSLVKKIKVIELVDDFTNEDSILIPLMQAAFGDQPLVTPICKILTKRTIETPIPIEDKQLSSENDCNIIIGSSLLSRPEVLTTAFGSLKDNGFVMSREPLNCDTSNTETTDFSIFTIHTTPSETIVLLKKKSKTKELTTLNIPTSNDEFPWIENLKDIIKMKKSDNLLLYSQNDAVNGTLGLVNCLRREPESTFVKGLLVLDQAEDFNEEKPFYKEQLNKNMAINIWKNGAWGTYRHLLLKELKTIESEHCYVNSTLRGDLSSLKWIESTLRTDMIVPPEKALVRVQYAALNFRDVMTASGKINADIITQDRLEQECVQGFEFAGLDQQGNRVMGMITHGALSSLVLADKYILFKAPDSLSLEQAATIPVVYGTVIYGMIIRGRLKRHETVLIHSGTGGIGQAAIRLALHYGCTVLTTVGTQQKKEFLLKTFPQLIENNIGNSHDLSFEKMVRNSTHGRGVDMVLNSLADQKLIASIRCLAHGGRFIEIGKFDLANNNEVNLQLLNKEASFHGVMLDSLMTCTPEIKTEIANILVENIGTFVIPLTTTVFAYDQIEDAFRFMSTGKHMGKVLIKVRDDDALPVNTIQKFSGTPRYFCYPDKTYIIIGGLGGFGLELADWLILRGAQNVVLTSRKGITTGYQQSRVKLWESYGVKVHISRDNICTEDGCRNMLQEASKLGEVQSIFNLAVVLADAIFENQTESTFKTSFGPKAVATTHLDKLSRELCPKLKDFVIFSSVTCGRGNAGQTNYGMANSVMERICEKRKSEGFPALAIEWGAVGDVGLVADLQEEHIELEIGGTLQQKISSCLNVLNNFLRQKDATIVSSIVVAEKRGGVESCDNIVDTIINILGLDNANISHHATLPELGMDSMTGVEIKQTLEREYEVFLTPKDMKTMTLAKLKEIQEQKCYSGEESDILDSISVVFDDVADQEEIKLTEVLLNPQLECESTSNLLLFPGIEGFARKFSKLSSYLDCPAISFQYWQQSEYQTIHEIAEFLLPTVESHIKPNERFNFVVYSYGSLIGLEIVHLLESKGYVGHVNIIDGGVLLMKKLFNGWMQNSYKVFETALLCHLLSFYVPTKTIGEQQENILKCNTWEERLEVAAQLVVKVTPDQTDHQRTLANGIYNKAMAIASYTPSYEKLKSTIKLFKPSQRLVKDIDEDYGLSNISCSDVQIEVIEGNHTSILANPLLGQAINSISKELRTKK